MTAILDKQFLDGDFLPADQAFEKYRKTKIEPLHDTYRLDDHEMMKDFERRRGLCLHSSELIHRIQNINPLIFVEHQINFEADWGLYRDVMGKQIYLSALPKGWLTEFSYTLVDNRDLPIEERRGWRTVLLKLLAEGAMTWQQVHAEFGDSDDENSSRWLAHTAPFRNYDSDGQVERNVGNHFTY